MGGPVHGAFDVVSKDSNHVRLHARINEVDTLYVYDGRRLLVHKAGRHSPYILYLVAARHPVAMAAVRPWRLNPGGKVFAHLCRGAARLPAAPTIAGRRALGYRCGAPKHHRGGDGSMWLDRETGVLLRNGVLRARTVTVLSRVDGSTFSTEPPHGGAREPSSIRVVTR
jgi:putative intracellular protease/amidase